MKLTVKQQAFADYYIETGNAYQSAIQSGYSENYAKGNVSKLLENERVRTYIDEKLSEMSSKRIADATEVLETLTAIVRGESRSATLIGLGEGAQKIEKEMPPSTAERIRAAELLGKRYKLFTDKVETTTDARVVIVDDV